MAPVTPGAFTFRKESLTEARKRLGLSQAQMAAKLRVPQNTLSRWENGSTTPDANSLAAIYSVAMENGYMPTFFAPVTQKAPVRDTPLVYWDGQSVATWLYPIGQLADLIASEVVKRVPHGKQPLFKVFLHSSQATHTVTLESLGWRAWEDDCDWYEDIWSQALSDSGHEPAAAVVFLVTADPDYAELIRQLRAKSVQVYLFAPQQVDKRLAEAVGKKRLITLPVTPLDLMPRRVYSRKNYGI